METLKKGSRGSDVKKLQELLHMRNCDGVFGPGTEAAVVEFQATHTDAAGKKLAADGIVGQKTWDALLAAQAKPTSAKLNINYRPTPELCTSQPGRKVKYIAIHYTAGASSAPGKAAANITAWIKRKKANPKDAASADFVVDDKEIVQVNPDPHKYRCWSVGGSVYKGNGGASLKGIATNGNTISIEICSTHRTGYNIKSPNHDGWYFTDAVIDNAVRLTRYLMKEFGIPIERVIRHYDINGKACPGIPGWNDAPLFDSKTGKKLTTRNTSEAWQDFKRRLQ